MGSYHLDRLWTAGMNAMLRRLWLVEKPPRYSDIADEISKEFHVKLTRNSVAGALRRMRTREGSDWPEAEIRKSYATRKYPKRVKEKMIRIRPRAYVVKEPPPIAPEPPAEPIAEGAYRLVELSSKQCHYPTGDLPGVTYCGRRIEHGSYCREHAERMYVAPKRRWE